MSDYMIFTVAVACMTFIATLFYLNLSSKIQRIKDQMLDFSQLFDKWQDCEDHLEGSDKIGEQEAFFLHMKGFFDKVTKNENEGGK